MSAHLDSDSSKKIVSRDIGTRLSLSFKLPDSQVNKLIPNQWSLNSPAIGPDRGSNFGISLFHQTLTLDLEGKPLPSRAYVVFSVPVKRAASDSKGNVMIVGGLIGADAGTGPYGVASEARVSVKKELENIAGKNLIHEKWNAEVYDGSKLEIKIQYLLDSPKHINLELKVHSAKDPEFFRLYNMDQVFDTVRSSADGVNKIQNLSIETSGPRFADLSIGSEGVIGASTVPHFFRTICLPA